MLKIFPNPKTIIYEDGTLLFKQNFFVEFSHEPDEEYNFGVKKLVDCVKKYTGSQLSSKKGEDTTVISFMLDEDLQKEEYRIDVFDEEIIIRNSGYVSAFRAITTLNQVLRQCKTNIPQFTLADKPDIENRGIMIDVSRGKVPKMEELKKLIDYMSELKYNQFQLYIDDIIFAYPSFPEYWKDNDPIMPDEILELGAYCKERCIELVPNQNCFGHMEKWLAIPELTHLAICEDGYTLPGYKHQPAHTLNPLDPESFELVKKIFADIMPYYESDYLNIGCDETNEIGMGKTEDAVKKTSKEEVYTNFLLKIRELAKKYGKQAMFWDDRLILTPEAIKKLPRDIIPLDWGYEPHSTMVESRTKFLAEEGFDFYVCPGTSTWNTFLGRSKNTVANQLRYAIYGKKYNALGFLLTEWGDGGHTQFPVVNNIPYTYGAGVSWGCDENADVADTLAYVDEYVFDGQYNGLSKLMFEAGNYYKLENVRRNNSTVIALSSSFGLKDTLEQSEETYETITKTRDYVYEKKEEVLALIGKDNEEVFAEELILEFDMTIIFAKALALVIDKKKAEADGIFIEDVVDNIEEIVDRFEELWLLKNRNHGLNIFKENARNAIIELEGLE